jgi:peptidyl-prolyl cis-trans isomerase C
VLHHARLELAFADIARQAPQPDLSTVQAWYLRHQTQFMRPEQRLTRHLLLTVDGDREAVHQRILGLYRQINASRDALLRWPPPFPLPKRPGRGRLGWISRGLLYPQLETALFSLAENALSLPSPASWAGIFYGVKRFAPPRPWSRSRRWRARAIIFGSRASSAISASGWNR